MQPEAMKDAVVTALDDLKGLNIVDINVGQYSDVTDYMVIASGSSNRHVKALADNVTDHMRKESVRPLGVEGTTGAEWVLVDFGEVVVHIMLPATRDFYDLERLWAAPAIGSD
jgi:ribosome-associated protein